MSGCWGHLGATKELTSPWLCWAADSFVSQHHLFEFQEKQFLFLVLLLMHEETYTELQSSKVKFREVGPFSWLDFPSMPSVTCQQTAGTGTWRGLRDRDTFPRKHTVKWLLGDPDLQRQVGTSWARSDWKRDALIAANTGACRGEGTVNLRNLPLSDSTMEQNLGKPKIHLKVLCGDITNLEVN